MKAQNKFAKLAILAILGSLLLSLSTLATAESDAVRAIYASAANVPTNIPGIDTYAEPPKGFNPLTATEVELATYGFPPRPDSQADPDGYALWERAMKAAKIRSNGELKPLPGIGHGMIPAGSSQLPDAVQPQTGPQRISTNNASGVMLKNTQKSFSSKYSFNQIATLITVAVAQVPFGTSCGSAGYNGYYYEISSAGIDGQINPANGYEFLSGVQGGVIAAACYGDQGQTFYWAYLGEWHNNLPLADFAVNPGDVFFTYVEVLNSDQTYVLLEDLTLGTYDTFTLPTPGIVGDAANWLVWRPGGCGSGSTYYCPLPNTVHIFFDGAAARTGSNKYFYPGSQASSTEILTMLDDGFDQSTETVNQGSAGYEGLHALMFSTINCAYSGGCTR